MSYKCDQCGKEFEERPLSTAWGCYCSDECLNAFREKRRALHNELRLEALSSAPEELRVPDFERFALKLAVHALSNLDGVQSIPQYMRHPDVLSLRVKEILLQYLPQDYISTWEEPSSWAYRFKKPIPRRLLFDAMRNAGFVWSVSW